MGKTAASLGESSTHLGIQIGIFWPKNDCQIAAGAGSRHKKLYKSKATGSCPNLHNCHRILRARRVTQQVSVDVQQTWRTLPEECVDICVDLFISGVVCEQTTGFDSWIQGLSSGMEGIDQHSSPNRCAKRVGIYEL